MAGLKPEHTSPSRALPTDIGPSGRILPSPTASWQGLSAAGFGLGGRRMRTGRLPGGESPRRHCQAEPWELGKKPPAKG